jgi:hypothetical protein
MDPPGAFGDTGAPVFDGGGHLVAIVANYDATGIGRLIDVSALRAAEQAWHDGCDKCCP